MKIIDDALHKLTCLVVSASDLDRHLLGTGLEKLGATDVLSCPSGTEAFNILNSRRQPVDLILADIHAPGFHGFALLQALRVGNIKNMRLNATFVLTTESPQIDHIQAASALDANGFIVKPVEFARFQTAIAKARRTVFPPNPGRHANVTLPAILGDARVK
ncbi:MAG: response regulator [Rhodospirillaceae bacterium]|nr:response regulator [Rhodospirillaceae bacterium]